MNDVFQFIQLKNSDGVDVILNVNNIVAIHATENGCYIRTMITDFRVSLNMTVDEFSILLPDLVKIGDINK